MASRRYFLPVLLKIVMYLSFLLSIFLLIVLASGSIRFVPVSKSEFLRHAKEEVPREPTVYDKMKPILKCYENSFETERVQEGEYWVLKNYIKAGHGKLKCHESITMTTNGDFTFLQHIPTLVERWRAPISMAIFSPGTDFEKTLQSIKFLLKCEPFNALIRKYVSFHIFFPIAHLPHEIPFTYEEFWVLTEVDCNEAPPYEEPDITSTYKAQNNLLYPINFARNLARKQSQTHFIFANDVELFPSLNLVEEFFKMVVRNSSVLTGKDPRVFAIAPFEIPSNRKIPDNKTQLLAMIQNNRAQPFHLKLCKSCHTIPKQKEWLNTNETTEMDLFSETKRTGPSKYWEPFYIGTNSEPFFDERISWEGQSNKRIQNFPMCLLNYDYMVLNNAFLVHHPGIKKKPGKDDPLREKYIKLTDKLIKNVIVPQFKILYGDREGCIV
ncbi:hypothetical protein ACFFRR_002488 [Megaselia abdita]